MSDREIWVRVIVTDTTLNVKGNCGTPQAITLLELGKIQLLRQMEGSGPTAPAGPDQAAAATTPQPSLAAELARRVA